MADSDSRDVRYRISRRLELVKKGFRCWNRAKVGNIFTGLDEVEKSILELQEREVREGGLPEHDSASLRSCLSAYQSLLLRQKTF